MDKEQTIIDMLKSLISKQEQLIQSRIKNFDITDKRIMILDIFRTFDCFSLYGEKDESSEIFTYYEYGMNELLRMLFDKFGTLPLFPLSKSNDERNIFTDHLLIDCSKIGICKRLLDYYMAGLVEINLEGKLIKVDFLSMESCEIFEKNASVNVQEIYNGAIVNPQKDILFKELPEIKKKMSALVYAWQKDFIGYSADPGVDHFFTRLAQILTYSDLAANEFRNDALFGNIPYKKYYDFAVEIRALSLKHEQFCSSLMSKTNTINPLNILTIPNVRKEMIESFSRYHEVSLTDSEQIIDCFTIDERNITYHTDEARPYPAPFIRLGNDTLLMSLVGARINPFGFLVRELKRKYANDYFSAVNAREDIFRKEFDDFFRDDFYIQATKTVEINTSKGRTDIDYVVYDKTNKILGLFQLKWQDLFGPSMKERFSRISNLYPKVSQWIDKVEAWISGNDRRKLLAKSGIPIDEEPDKILLFTICRHHALFTSCNPDSRTAWSSLWNLAQTMTQFQNQSNNLLEFLYDSFKKQQTDLINKNRQRFVEELDILDYKIIMN